jgi:anthranilate phosphoribosyltransferase
MSPETPSWPALTARLVRHEDLSTEDASWAMDSVMTGEADPVQLAAFLVALASKGVTSPELVGLADGMVAHARSLEVNRNAVDIVGTGGDLAQTVNISTMASVVIASSGRLVVKHGNRASTSKSGSADVLEALGIRLDLPVEAVRQAADRVGITFLFAQVFHPAMRFAAPARKALPGIPTVFNVLGPITNPARPAASAVGVADPEMAPIVADVFARRGASALVFRGHDGLDELTVGAPSDVWEVRGGAVTRQLLDPHELFGIARHPVSALRGGVAAENAQVALDVFQGRGSEAVRDAVLLNAAAGIAAFDGIGAPASDAGFEERMTAAYESAQETLDSGAPSELIQRWTSVSQELFAQEG